MSKFDEKYLEMAQVWAKNSYCKRRQVGALIVKDYIRWIQWNSVRL